MRFCTARRYARSSLLVSQCETAIFPICRSLARRRRSGSRGPSDAGLLAGPTDPNRPPKSPLRARPDRVGVSAPALSISHRRAFDAQRQTGTRPVVVPGGAGPPMDLASAIGRPIRTHARSGSSLSFNPRSKEKTMKTKIHLPACTPEQRRSLRREVRQLLGPHRRGLASVEIRRLHSALVQPEDGWLCEVTVRFRHGGYLCIVDREAHVGRAVLRAAWRVEQRRELGRGRFAFIQREFSTS